MPRLIEPSVRHPVVPPIADAGGGTGDSPKLFQTMPRDTKLAARIGLALSLFLPGCSSIGPGTVPRDRVDYITALRSPGKNRRS